VSQSPSLLLPFIFEHKINNLSESTKEQLAELWKKKDPRVVEELVVAGCEYGEEMALSRGWMRALRKMVVNGMEIHFPLIKLSSFVVTEKKEMENLAKEPNSAEAYQTTLSKIKDYCMQMVEYSLLALSEFLAPSEMQLQRLS
jgi:hypothetical protein